LTFESCIVHYQIRTERFGFFFFTGNNKGLPIPVSQREPGGFKWSLHHLRKCDVMKKSKYTIDDWRTVKALTAQGFTIRAIQKKTGINRTTVNRWQRLDAPREWMWLNLKEPETTDESMRNKQRSVKQRLSYEDRVYISAMLKQNIAPTAIAREIGVSRTTIMREIKRVEGSYDPRAAQVDANKKATRPKKQKLTANTRLRSYVIDCLLKHWSPTQISKRLKQEYPEDKDMQISHEAIYQAIYIQGKGSLRQELALEKALRSGNNRRKPHSALPQKGRNKSWVDGCEISVRPPEIEDRAIPGHWEGDLIIGGDMKSCLVTLVERKTRFLVARRLESKDTRTVVDCLIEMAKAVPESLRSALLKSLTWDQGMELADVARFKTETGFKVYFCDPHSPWQKGTNENTNGLIRQYFPKGTHFAKVTDEEVMEMQDQMNGRPRQTLNWKTPAEALNEELYQFVQ